MTIKIENKCFIAYIVYTNNACNFILSKSVYTEFVIVFIKLYKYIGKLKYYDYYNINNAFKIINVNTITLTFTKQFMT